VSEEPNWTSALQILERLQAPRPDAVMIASELEADFLQLLQVINRSPSLRARFSDLFSRMIRGEIPEPENMVAFCMHELRWPEVLEVAKREAAKWDPRTLSVATQVVEAFQDDWRDRVLFPHYSSP
jgi:hypothetical protein